MDDVIASVFINTIVMGIAFVMYHTKIERKKK